MIPLDFLQSAAVVPIVSGRDAAIVPRYVLQGEACLRVSAAGSRDRLCGWRSWEFAGKWRQARDGFLVEARSRN